MKLTFGSQTLDLTPKGRGYLAASGEKTAFIEVNHSGNGRLELLIDGQRLTAYVSTDGSQRWVTVGGRTTVLTKSSGGRRAGARHEHPSDLAAPMPGQVRSVNVSVGEAVKKGQTLLVIEAMKMEIRVQAPNDGKIKALYVKPGQTVEREQILIEVEE